MLVQNMSPVEGVLLGLTCKSLWAQTHRKDVFEDLKRCTPLDEMRHFIRMLEKDRCRYVACTACLRLHLRTSDEAMSMGSFVELPNRRRRCHDKLGVVKTNGPFSKRLAVYRETFELVLRVGVPGQHVCLPLKCFRQQNEWEYFGHARIKIHFKSDAAIIPVPVSRDGEGPHLFIKTIYFVDFDLRRALPDQIEGAEIGGCCHNHDAESKFIMDAIETARKDPLTRRPLDVLRCSGCPTDMVVEVFYKAREVFAGVCLTAYRDLGPSGDHQGQIWVRQKALYVRNNDFDRGTKYAFGNQKLHLLWEDIERQVDVEESEGPKPKETEAETRVGHMKSP